MNFSDRDFKSEAVTQQVKHNDGAFRLIAEANDTIGKARGLKAEQAMEKLLETMEKLLTAAEEKIK